MPFDPSQPFEIVEETPKETWSGVAKNTAIDAAKGVISLGEGVVGIADLATGNIVGEGLSKTGYDPTKAKEIVSEGYTPRRKQANKEVSKAKGFFGTVEALIDHPSVAFGAIVESAPMTASGVAAARYAAVKMLGSALTANGIKAGSGAARTFATKFFANPKVQTKLVMVGAGTEGAQTAGLIQEQGRQGGREYSETVGPALAAGAGTAAIGGLTSKIPGFRDAEASLATAGIGGQFSAKKVPANIAKGIVKEGPLEEMPQSAWEQGMTNVAMGDPIGEGIPEAAATGTVIGAAQGGGMITASELMNSFKANIQPIDKEKTSNLGTIAQNIAEVEREVEAKEIIDEIAPIIGTPIGETYENTELGGNKMASEAEALDLEATTGVSQESALPVDGENIAGDVFDPEQPFEIKEPDVKTDPALDLILEEINNGEVSKSYQNEDGETSPTVSTYPDWFKQRTVKAYNKKFGTKINLSKSNVTATINKVKNNLPLVGHQNQIWEYLQSVIEEKRGNDPALKVQDKLTELSEEGFEFEAPQKMAVGELNPGDEVVVDRNGVPDKLTHRGFTSAGDSILQDGVTMHVDQFEQIDVIAKKQSAGVAEKDQIFKLVNDIKTNATDEDVTRMESELGPFFSERPHLEPYWEMVSGAIEARKKSIEGKTSEEPVSTKNDDTGASEAVKPEDGAVTADTRQIDDGLPNEDIRIQESAEIKGGGQISPDEPTGKAVQETVSEKLAASGFPVASSNSMEEEPIGDPSVYENILRKNAESSSANWDGRSLKPLASDIVEFTIKNKVRLSDTDKAELAKKHDVTPEVVGMMSQGMIGYDLVLEKSMSGDIDAKAFLNNGVSTKAVKQDTPPDKGGVAVGVKFSQSNKKAVEKGLRKRLVRGDNLLNAIDLADELSEKGGVVSDDGFVTLYHRTSKQNAAKIIKEGRIVGKEDNLFFGTSPNGEIDGYGDTVVKVSLPLEKLNLDDVFENEAHVTYKIGSRGFANIKAEVVKFSQSTESQQTPLTEKQQNPLGLKEHNGQVNFTNSLEEALGGRFKVTPWRMPDSLVRKDSKGRVHMGGSPQSDFELAERIAKIIGKKIIWANIGEEFSVNGVVVRNGVLANYIFIDPRTAHPVHAIYGHELSHFLETEYPQQYKELFEIVSPLIKDVDRYRDNLQLFKDGDEEIKKEIIGDLMGDAFNDPTFWEEVAAQSPSKFRAIAQKIRMWIDNLLRDFLARGFGSEQYVTDLTKTRKALAQLMAKTTSEKRRNDLAKTARGYLFAQDAKLSVQAAVKKVTDNPNFRKWFGEDNSLQEDDGTPILVYHGTPDGRFGLPGIREHDETNLEGFTVTLDKNVADNYANNKIKRNKVQPKNPTIMPLFVKGKMITIKELRELAEQEEAAIREEFEDTGLYVSDYSQIDKTGLALDLGYTMIDMREEMGDGEILVIDTSAIKSATDNNGEFSPNNPDIRFSMSTTDDYAENRAITKNYKNQVLRKVREAGRNIVGGLDKYLGATSTRLRKINPKIESKIRELDFRIGKNSADDVKAIQGMLQKAKAMTADDFKDWDYARKNGDTEKINELVDKYNLKAEYENYRKTLDKIRAEAIDVGLDVGFIEEYSPRILKDAEGFLLAIGKEKDWDIISRRLKKRAEEIDIPVHDMTPEMRADIISNMMHGGFGLSGPAGAKERKVKKIPPHLNQYYMHSDAALVNYLHSMRKAIEARRFFGKVPEKISTAKRNLHRNMTLLAEENKKPEPNEKRIETLTDNIAEYRREIEKYKYQRDFTENIGAYIDELLINKEITPEQENTLVDLLTARFHEKGTHGLIQAYKNFSYIDTMGSPISAITQIGDLAWAVYENGWGATSRAVINSIRKSSRIVKEDVGIERIAQEFADSDTLSNAVAKVFKWVGLEKMDAIGKEAMLNGALEKFEKRAQDDQAKLKAEIQHMFEGETDSVISDLQNKKITDNVKFLIYSKLLDYQPVGLSEMSEMYLQAGNGRLFYMLKSYTLKQFDVFRRESYEKIKNGTKPEKIEAIRKTIYLAALLVLANAGADELKDLILGRKTSLSDRATDNVLRLFGVSKFVTWKARTDGAGSAMVRQILPPFKFIDSLSKDVVLAGDGKGLYTTQSVPIVGKLAYWHMGRGQTSRLELYEKRFSGEKKKLKEIKEIIEQDPKKAASYSKEMNRLSRVNIFQKKLTKNKKQINELKKRQKLGMKVGDKIKKMEDDRAEMIKQFLSGLR